MRCGYQELSAGEIKNIYKIILIPGNLYLLGYFVCRIFAGNLVFT